MIFLNLLVVLIVPLVFGLVLLSLLIQKGAQHFSPWEKLALAFPLGLGFIALIMFFLGILKMPLTLASIMISIALISLLIGLYLLRTRSFCFTPNEFKFSVPKMNAVEIILLALISLKVLFVIFSAIIKPVVDVDAFQQYSIVAKAIFFDGGFTLPYLNQFYGDKPLLPFLAQGWAFLGLGTPNDALMKVIFPTLFLCLLVIFYSILKRQFNRLHSMLFTWLLCSLPFLVYHATTAYADVTITVYYAAATFYLYLFMKEQKSDLAAVGFALLGFAVWAKKAGFILAGVNILFLLIYLIAQKDSRLWRKAAIPFIIFLIIVLPWLALGRLGTFESVIRSFIGAKTSSVAAPAAVQPAPVESKLPAIISIFGRKLFLYGDWHLTWGLLVISLVFFYRQAFRPPLVYLLGIILLDFTSLFVQFGSGETFRWLLDGTLFDRLVMNEVPLVLFFCAAAILVPGTALPPDSKQVKKRRQQH